MRAFVALLSATFILSITAEYSKSPLFIDLDIEISTEWISQLEIPEESSIADEEIEVIYDRPGFTLQNPRTPAQEVEDSLEWIIELLKSFFHELDFSNQNFDRQSKNLANYLREISTWAESFSRKDRGILNRLNFAKHMFSVMETAALYLNFIFYDDTCSYSAMRVIQLNVRLLTLHNSEGEPDHLKQGYNESVSGFVRILDSWKSLFANVAMNCPLSLRLVFDSELAKAESTLHVLRSYIPTPF